MRQPAWRAPVEPRSAQPLRVGVIEAQVVAADDARVKLIAGLAGRVDLDLGDIEVRKLYP